MKNALILFMRKPELGKVKTRLAATIGNEAALDIYKKLLQHTHQITSNLGCDRFVFYADGIDNSDLWSDGYYKLAQANGDLGEKMQLAFTHLFKQGYAHICIIGTDCYELTTAIIEDAFSLLNHNEIVLGPARDGGYYLLGMKNDLKDIFSGIEWSTEKVLEQTISRIRHHNYSYTLLKNLTDIDTEQDLPEEWKQLTFPS